MNLYIIDDQGNPKLVKNIRTWGKWCDENKSSLTLSKNIIDGVVILTTFIAAGSDEIDPPFLWDTLVIGGKFNRLNHQYQSRQEALKGHLAVLDMIMKGS